MKIGDLVLFKLPPYRLLGVGIVLVPNVAKSGLDEVYIAGKKHWLNVDTLEVIHEGR